MKFHYLDTIVSPNVTEKSTSLSQLNKVVFKVISLNARGNNSDYYVHIRTNFTLLPWQYYQAKFSVTREWEMHNLDLKGTILKPNMVLPGSSSLEKSNTDEIAKMTLQCLKSNVPAEVPGIAFLSGGQSEFEATKNLNAINKINDSDFAITFSYGRALQQSALSNWGKNQDDITNTQQIFNHRAKMNSLSSTGKWTEDIDTIHT